MAVEKFDVRATSLKSLFSDYTFIVPRFQRRYLWDAEQIDALWADIEGAIQRNDADYFLGTAVLVGEDTKATVIDGQQRLATLTMMLAAIRDQLEQLGHSDNAKDLHSLVVKTFLGEKSWVKSRFSHRISFEAA